MTRLSVNINKIALLRNARGGNMPDVLKAALDCETFGAQGITVHPRPDERHIRYSDVRTLRPALKTEFNIEGNPTGSFTALVCEVVPDQVTLVPDAPDDRVELYTAAYAEMYPADRQKAIAPYLETAEKARQLGLGLNAGHDLNLDNLSYFIKTIPWTDEVSIGHALICDALYMGLETAIGRYLSAIQNF